MFAERGSHWRSCKIIEVHSFIHKESIERERESHLRCMRMIVYCHCSVLEIISSATVLPYGGKDKEIKMDEEGEGERVRERKDER